MDTQVEDRHDELLDRIIDQIESRDEPRLRALVADLHPAENADLLESLPPEQRSTLWEAMPPAQEGEILSHLGDEARATIIGEMDHADLVAAAEHHG